MPHLIRLSTACLLAIVLPFGSVSIAVAAAVSAITDGNWNVAGNWSPAIVPGAADDVTIGPGLNMDVTDARSALSLNVNSNNAQALDITGTGSLVLGTGNSGWSGTNNSAFRVDGSLSLNGLFSLSAVGRRIEGTGTVTIENGGIFSYDRTTLDSFEMFDGADMIINSGGLFRFTEDTDAGAVSARGFEFRGVGNLELNSGGTIQANLPTGSQIASLDGAAGTGVFNIDTGGTLEVLNGELESTFSLANTTVNNVAPTSTLLFNVRLIDSDGAGANAATLDFRNYPAITTVGTGATLELSGPNTAFVNNATDLIAGLDTVEGTLLVSDGKSLTPGGGTVTVQNGGVIGGDNGFIDGTIVIEDGGTDAPGNSVGQGTTDNETWMAGGTFQFQIDDATGTAGISPGWDLRVVEDGGNGTLDITDLTNGNFIIDIESLATGTDTPGALANFDEEQSYEWEFITFEQLNGAFDEAQFTLDASDFLAQNDIEGIFGIIETENGLAITFTAIPEPATIAIWSLLGLVGLGFGYRQVQRKK